jgi:hypothetical protein
MNQMQKKRYKEQISFYPKKLTSHFPKEIIVQRYSYTNLIVAGYYALHYSGFELFINYTDDKERENLLREIKEKFIDTTIIQGDNILFLNTISNYCDSVDNNKNYIIYPYPNVQEYVKIQNEEQVEKINYSLDLKESVYYVIEIKDTIIYEEQKTNYCSILEKELKHGYSRGVMLNKKDKFLFYWLYFW